MYQQHLKPMVYIPLHVTDVAVPSSSPEFKKSYIETLDTAQVAFRPELRWLVDPNDFARPMVYDPSDRRWASPDNARRVAEFCDDRSHRH